MILAGAIFACLIGIIYLLWNQRTQQKQLENLENNLVVLQSGLGRGRGQSTVMPPLDEVIAHYEKQLEEEPEETEGTEEEEETEQQEEKVVELGQQEESKFQMSQFSGVLSKELKELCKKLGFSSKGNKKELVSRLLQHPQYQTVEQLLEEFKKDTQSETETEKPQTEKVLEMVEEEEEEDEN